MGRNSEGKVVDLDEQIEYLDTQIQAYKARVSLLQRQHISALDTLDQVVQNHRAELAAEYTTRQHLEHRLHKAKQALKTLGKEKDELQDVVLELIEKVEESHGNLQQWAPPKLQLSSFCYPATKEEGAFGYSKTTEVQEHLVYADGIIRSLKHELYLERQAHAQTRARILTLEAKIAHRDAALEAWAQNAELLTPPINSSSPKSGGKEPVNPGRLRDLDREQISSLFLQTLQNNRTLEHEIRNLFENLEKAHSRAANPVQHQAPSLLRPSSPLPERGRSIDRKRRSSQPRPSIHRPLLPHSKGEVKMEVPQFSDQNIRIRRRALSSPSIPSSPQGDHHSTTFMPRFRPLSVSKPPQKTLPLASTSSEANSTLKHLDEQIRALSTQIDAFRAERVELLQVISSELPQAAPDIAIQLRDIFREDVVNVQNEASGPVDVGDDSERSMELATPLLPSMSLYGSEPGLRSLRDQDRRYRNGSSSPPIITSTPLDRLVLGNGLEERQPSANLAETIHEDSDDEIRMIRPRTGSPLPL